MRIIAGVDCHKSSHTIAFVNAVGELVERLSIPTTAEGYEQALSAGERLGCKEWGLEGAGCYGFALGVFVAARGHRVLEVPGVLTKRHRRHGSVRGKSDDTDAKAIAEVVLREADRLPGFYPSTTQRALRLRYDQRDRYVRARTCAANRLRMAAVLIGVTALPRDITSTKAAHRLATAAQSFGHEVAHHPAAAAIMDDLRDAAEEIVRLNDKIRGVEKQLRSLLRDIAPDLLMLHGVSSVVASGLVGHAGAMTNYRNAAAFAAKCGAAPVPCSSGRHISVRLNTGGDRQLNRLLHVVAMTQVRAPAHPGRRYYERKRSEGKAHRAALRCLKRQLATVVYYRLLAVQRRLDGRDEVLADVA